MTTRKRRSAIGTRRRPTVLWSAGLAGLLILVAIVLYLPFVWTGYLSFTKYSGLGKATWIGMENYREMFVDPEISTRWSTPCTGWSGRSPCRSDSVW